jgi:hypothetical protein
MSPDPPAQPARDAAERLAAEFVRGTRRDLASWLEVVEAHAGLLRARLDEARALSGRDRDRLVHSAAAIEAAGRELAALLARLGRAEPAPAAPGESEHGSGRTEP